VNDSAGAETATEAVCVESDSKIIMDKIKNNELDPEELNAIKNELVSTIAKTEQIQLVGVATMAISAAQNMALMFGLVSVLGLLTAGVTYVVDRTIQRLNKNKNNDSNNLQQLNQLENSKCAMLMLPTGYFGEPNNNK
jgi:hypothetical protein